MALRSAWESGIYLSSASDSTNIINEQMFESLKTTFILAFSLTTTYQHFYNMQIAFLSFGFEKYMFLHNVKGKNPL